MTECCKIQPNLNAEQRFKLNKINKVKDYYGAEIKEKELMSKRLSNYIAYFGYVDKSLIVLSVTTGSISIASAIVKKLLKATRNKKKKHNKIVMLPRSKLNSIENKISEALIDNEISQEDFMTIINSQRSDIEKINLIEEFKK